MVGRRAGTLGHKKPRAPRSRSSGHGDHSAKSQLLGRPPSIQKLLGNHMSANVVVRFLQKVVTFAEDYLDFNVGIKEQDDRALDKFIHDACRRFPVFCKYERAWPLREYIATQLRITSKKRRQERETPSVSRELQPNVRVTNSPVAFNTRLNTKTKKAAASKRKRAPSEQKENSESDIENIETVEHQPVAVARGASQSDPQNDVPARLTDAESPDHIKIFLRSLQPTLEHLLPVFDKLGIRTKSWLSGMASWPRDRRDEVLMNFVEEEKITRIEYETIRLAFDRGDVLNME